mgnify:FL=1
MFDWELASIYPFGYDLFTYVFQTATLLHPQKNIEEVYLQHKNSIVALFDHWGIANYIPYLVAFAEIKFAQESKKKNTILILFYKKLITYVKTL